MSPAWRKRYACASSLTRGSIASAAQVLAENPEQ